jgi:hypothetical protein
MMNWLQQGRIKFLDLRSFRNFVSLSRVNSMGLMLKLFLLQTNTRRSIAAEASPFCLDTKRTKKIKTEKSFRATGHTPWPAFLSGLYPLLIR